MKWFVPDVVKVESNKCVATAFGADITLTITTSSLLFEKCPARRTAGSSQPISWYHKLFGIRSKALHRGNNRLSSYGHTFWLTRTRLFNARKSHRLNKQCINVSMRPRDKGRVQENWIYVFGPVSAHVVGWVATRRLTNEFWVSIFEKLRPLRFFFFWKNKKLSAYTLVILILIPCENIVSGFPIFCNFLPSVSFPAAF